MKRCEKSPLFHYQWQETKGFLGKRGRPAIEKGLTTPIFGKSRGNELLTQLKKGGGLSLKKRKRVVFPRREGESL